MKAPAFQFYTGDWKKDVELHMMSFQSRGLWIEMLMSMWDATERGKLEGTKAQLCRTLGCSIEEIETTIQELSVTKTADVTLCNDFVTIINRRMYREERERKLTRSRVQKYRVTEMKRSCNDNVTAPSSTSSSSSGTKVPIKEPNGSLSESIKTNSDGNGKVPPCPQQEIVNLYHKTLPELPRVKQWPENLQVILRTRWKEDPARQNLAWWERFFQYVQESNFLVGRTKEAFVADLEWLIRPRNFTKIANGRYHGRGNLSVKRQPGIEAWLMERSEHDQTG